MSLFAAHNRNRVLDFTLAIAATVVIASLVIADGSIPSLFTTAFFAPIIGEPENHRSMPFLYFYIHLPSGM